MGVTGLSHSSEATVVMIALSFPAPTHPSSGWPIVGGIGNDPLRAGKAWAVFDPTSILLKKQDIRPQQG